jgi:hypothetical protein
MNSPPPKPEVILTNFCTEPTVLLVPITSREYVKMHYNRIIYMRTTNIYCLTAPDHNSSLTGIGFPLPKHKRIE